MMSFQACSDDPVSPVITGIISGRVMDAETGAPISMASITTNPSTVAITTDSTGIYRINDVSEGSYSIKAVKKGYKSTTITVYVKVEKTTQADIFIEKELSENAAPFAVSKPNPANGAT
jgi:TolB protein